MMENRHSKLDSKPDLLDHHDNDAFSESILSEDEGKKTNFFIRLLRKLALPSHAELKNFNWRSVKAQFELLENYDECQKDIYMVESNEIDPVDCPYRIDDFLGEIPSHAVGWSGVPSEVHSLYTNAPLDDRSQFKKKKSLGIPISELTEDESLQLLEDLFHDIPNEEIAWAKIPAELEILLEESLQHKWKETDFTPELPKINNLLRKKLNKQMKFEDRRPDWDDYSFSEDESSIGSFEEVKVHYDHFDLDGLSEDNLSNEDANWSDIEDAPEDKEFKLNDPTFFKDLEEIFGLKYRGDNDDDKDFIDVLSDTSSVFGDIPEQEYEGVKTALEKMFDQMPELIEVALDHAAGGIFSESNFQTEDEGIEVSSDIDELFGDNSEDEFEIHSDQSSLYDTDSSEEDTEGNKDYIENQRKRKIALSLDNGGKDNIDIGLRKIKVVPPLELTDMELKDFIKLQFLEHRGKPLSTMINALTPLENEIECLIQISADIRGYGKTEEEDDLVPVPIENYPKLDGPTYAWANVSRQASIEEQFGTLNIADKINIVPSHYSLELNMPKVCHVHPVVLNDEIHRFQEPKSVQDYKLSKRSIEKLQTIKRKRAKPLKSRICFCPSKLQKCAHNFFHKTSVGKAMRKNTRYYKKEVHFPKFCRRCQVPLEEALVPTITPISATFCCLFPILSAPCFYAHQEYRCFICKEIYVFGDFKPPAEPTAEDVEERRRLEELKEEKRLLRRKFSNPKYS